MSCRHKDPTTAQSFLICCPQHLYSFYPLHSASWTVLLGATPPHPYFLVLYCSQCHCAYPVLLPALFSLPEHYSRGEAGRMGASFTTGHGLWWDGRKVHGNSPFSQHLCFSCIQELLLDGHQLCLDVEVSRNTVNARHQSFCCSVQALLVWVQFPKVLCKLSDSTEVTLWAGALLCHPPSLAGWLLASPSQPSLPCKAAISSTVHRAPCEQQALSVLPHSLQCKSGPRALPMDFPEPQVPPPFWKEAALFRAAALQKHPLQHTLA